MKKLFRLLVLGIIIGITIKYLNEKDIRVTDIASRVIGKVSSVVSEFDFEDRIKESFSPENNRREDDPAASYNSERKSNPGILYSSDNHNSRGYISSEGLAKRIDLTGTDVEATEYKIPSTISLKNSRISELDAFAATLPSSFETNIKAMVSHLCEPAKDDLEKIRLIFNWIALNVKYDDHGYNTGNYSDISPEGVFRNRRAVCQGFSDLFTAMGELAGLEIISVNGYSKGISYRQGKHFPGTNHAWNLAKIDGKWKLFDVTWASGYGEAVNGKLVTVSRFEDFWFDTPPDAFIFTHLPEDPRLSLTSIPVSKKQFEDLPYASSSLFKIGFDGTSCLQDLLKGSFRNFPEAYQGKGSITALSLPYSRNFPAGEPVLIKLLSSDARDIAIVNNGEWVHLAKAGNEFMAIINPQPGVLSINAKFDENNTSYDTLLEYSVN